ncbi:MULTISPECIES: trigger factor [unclassified Marinobacterium]|jgi:trigger factor|uniref:trigger factor n=1 Tax=unclassified Marinobacterium TaxID=2644139 RepID=UPI0015698877|nr:MULTISPECIES: trigger factor [unclassified Marinobacterium]NRP36400.1 Trigger factor [Marinobacterium sp. xm-d-579]NRP48185.1 Trigger factor [Marinobacterium sp. xm-d-543]NRP60495.1 Trigger factor [Marinobacterium sp. xm-d-564]NRP82802.1 Trigger factor [Marinobacterium sp. xm-d-509]NRP93967.1 Trigger factor [Marinobacterium sp. xm-g-59]
MQVSVETTSGLQRQLTVTVPAERIDTDVEKQVVQQARTRRMDGFRPGKVPAKVIKRMYGDAIRYEVLNRVVQETFYEAVQQESLMPAGAPSIEFKTDKEGEDFAYVATFDVYPEIELKDLAGVEVEKATASIKAADVKNMIDTLRKQQSTFKATRGMVKEGFQVNIDFEGFVDGEAFEGGKAEGQDLVIGSGSMIPGFEDGIIGKKKGEEFDVEVTFPEEYQSEALAGKAATFKMKLNEVSKPELPELNEEFFAKFGVSSADEAEFKAEVEKNMAREMNHALKTKTKTAVFDALIAQNEIEAPAAMIDDEVNVLRQQAVQQFGGQAQIDPNTLPKELFEEQAIRRVKIGLLVQEVIKAGNLEATDERVDAILADIAESYDDADEVISYYKGNEQMLNQIRSLALEDEVVDHLLASAKVKEVKVSYEEALKPAQQ